VAAPARPSAGILSNGGQSEDPVPIGAPANQREPPRTSLTNPANLARGGSAARACQSPRKLDERNTLGGAISLSAGGSWLKGKGGTGPQVGGSHVNGLDRVSVDLTSDGEEDEFLLNLDWRSTPPVSGGLHKPPSKQKGTAEATRKALRGSEFDGGKAFDHGGGRDERIEEVGGSWFWTDSLAPTPRGGGLGRGGTFEGADAFFGGSSSVFSDGGRNLGFAPREEAGIGRSLLDPATELRSKREGFLSRVAPNSRLIRDVDPLSSHGGKKPSAACSPGSDRILLLVDHRERRHRNERNSLLEDLIREHNGCGIGVMQQQLVLGDYIWVVEKDKRR
jgi:hypothetical protein